MAFKPILRDFQSRFSFLLDAKYGLQRNLRKIRKTPFEAEYAILDVLVPSGRSVIDIGANRGQSIDAIRLYHPDVDIHAFEPNKGLYENLVAQFSKQKNLKLYNLGLGQKVYSAPLYIPYYRNFMYDGLSSFTKDRAAKWLNASSVWRFKPSLLRIEETICSIDLLDNYAFTPFLVKIHVQGFEADVLEGAKNLISSQNPVLLMANNIKADLWLRKKGWHQYVLINGKWVKLEVNAMEHYNCVYLNPAINEHQDIIKRLRPR